MRVQDRDSEGKTKLENPVTTGKDGVYWFYADNGRYAIALLHDENGNGKIDKALMIPREGFGFSRDAPLRMGPPSFKDAAFDVDAKGVNQSIRMRYII